MEGCTYYSDFTYDSACRTVASPIHSETLSSLNSDGTSRWEYATQFLHIDFPGYVYSSLSTGIPVFAYDASNPTSASCMAGPFSCSVYSETQCPPGLAPASWGNSGEITTVYCCPSVTISQNSGEVNTITVDRQQLYFSERLSAADSNGSPQSVTVRSRERYICGYTWADSTGSALPATITPLERPYTSIHRFFYSAVVAEHASFALSSPSVTTTSPTLDPSEAQGTRTGTPNSTEDSGGGTLSAGAKAGIGVGAAIGGLLLFSIIFAAFFLRRRKQKRAAASGGYTGKPELQGTEVEKQNHAREASGTQLFELGDTSQPIEIDNQTGLTEAPGKLQELGESRTPGELEGNTPESRGHITEKK